MHLQRFAATTGSIPKLGGDYARVIASRQQTEYLITGGIFGEDEHPSRILRDKSEPGDRIGELYDRMINDDTTLGGLDEKRTKAVTGLPWSIVAGDEGDQAQEIADTCAEMLDAIQGVGTNLAHQLGAVARGCAIDELRWEVQRQRRGRLTGLWRPAEIFDRPLHRFAFKDGVLHVRKKDGGLELVPPLRFIHGCYGTKDSAWGRPLIDRVYWPFFMTIHFWKYAGVAAEKWAQPTVIVRYDYSTEGKVNDERVARALSAAADFQTEYAIALPKDVELELKEAIRSGTLTYESLIMLNDRAKALVWLGEVDTSGMSQGPGSFAKNRVSNEVRYETIVADATWLAETLTDQLVRPFVLVNFGADAPMPYWEFDVEEASDRQQRQEGMAKVLDRGQPVARRAFYRVHQAQVPKPGEEVIEGRKAAPALPPLGRPTPAPPPAVDEDEDEQPAAARGGWADQELAA